ncbi:hypothetical protein [Wukongibacter sp. M2B1]|uniref:hypothetical protein n=1 Tax=Wukongibacter sp. M2B1 TaxID=3088895 RepID=UPI003D7B45D3
MIDHNSPVISCRDDLIAFLKTRFDYLDIRESYINVDQDFPLKKTLITVSKGKPIVKNIGFDNYLGESYDEINEEIIETKGKELSIFYDLHIWNNKSPKFGGEKEIERIQEQLQSIFEFESDVLDDITFFSFKEGDIVEDPFKEELFHSRCRLEVRILWKREFKYEVINEIIPHADLLE